MINKPINHNDPIARLRASLPQEFDTQYATITDLKKKFVKTGRERKLATEFNLLIQNATECRDPNLPPSLDNRGEGRGLALIGPTGVGKTRSLRTLFKNHPVIEGYRDPASPSPLLWLSAPSPCTITQLGRRILFASGYPVERELPAHRLFELAGQRLNAMGKPVLAIEEFQHVTHNTSDRDQQTVADILKHLMEAERISVIISGIETLKPFLALDSQLDRRMSKVYFNRLEPTDIDTLADIVHGYVEQAGMEIAYSDADALFPRLMHASLYALGLSIENTIAAIAWAKQSGAGTLNKAHFSATYAAKSGKPASENPYEAERWYEVKVETTVEKPNPNGPTPPAARGKDRK